VLGHLGRRGRLRDHRERYFPFPDGIAFTRPLPPPVHTGAVQHERESDSGPGPGISDIERYIAAPAADTGSASRRCLFAYAGRCASARARRHSLGGIREQPYVGRSGPWCGNWRQCSSPTSWPWHFPLGRWFRCSCIAFTSGKECCF